MAGSFPIFDRVVEHVIAGVAPQRLLDIGAGSGKYGHLAASAAPGCERVALEVHEPHVQGYDLRSLYHRVEVVDAAQWCQATPDERFDLVIAGDVLQNLPKSAGLDLLNAMVYRSAWIVVVLPEFIVQGAVDGVHSTVHRSVWSERDLHWHDLWAWDNVRSISFALLRGYAPSSVTMDEFVRHFNEAAVPIQDYDGSSFVRPCRLRLVDHAREVAYRPR